MARIRTTKPEFYTSEQVMNLSIPARFAFQGLWTFCDDGGNHPASSKTLKAEIFPSDDLTSVEVQTLVEEMVGQGLLALYEASGKQYWHVTGWHHQRIDKPSYKYPKFEEHSKNVTGGFGEASKNDLRPFTPGVEGTVSGVEGIGVEGKGVEGISPTALVKTQPVGSVVDARDLLGDVELSKKTQCPAETLKTVFNEECTLLPTITKLSDTRKKHLQARWEELDKELHFATVDDGVQAFREFFKKVQASRYLTGQKNGFRASFDWLMTPANFLKTREGNYDENKTAPGQTKSRMFNLPTAADFAADQEGL